MHPDVMLLLANERQARLRDEAAADRSRRAARRTAPAPRVPDSRNLTLRLDRVGDASRLYQLAALSERQLPGGSFVVAEIDDRLVAAVPVYGGAALTDPFEPTAHLLPLLRLRAAQIRRVDVQPRRLRMPLPRRA